ncbi:hypothetical protein [Cellulophaga baltica]|uniref:hypothetical protein n=1 Tax=Cellulophaga baltica TaxID=76594 RepID=UPI0003FDD9EF|nr:hypothetical protein [Cellulophaga baltica]
MRIVTFVLGVFLFCTACTDNDDDFTQDESLSGEWVLTDVSCFCGFPEDVDFSVHTLNFSEEDHSVIIENDETTYYFHIAGTYSYTNIEGIISLQDTDQEYTYVVEDDVLTLTYIDEPMIADDEVMYTYLRN